MQVSDRALGALYDLSPRSRSVRPFGQPVPDAVREPRSSEPDERRASPPVAQVVEGEWLRRVTAAANRGPTPESTNVSSQAARGAAFYRALADIETEFDDKPRGLRVDVYA